MRPRGAANTSPRLSRDFASKVTRSMTSEIRLKAAGGFGRSAHLEAGYFVGAGKPLFILILEKCEPELMYKMATAICLTFGELAGRLARYPDETPAPAGRELRKSERVLLDNLETVDVQERTVTLTVSTALWENWQSDWKAHVVAPPGKPAQEPCECCDGQGHNYLVLTGETFECPVCHGTGKTPTSEPRIEVISNARGQPAPPGAAVPREVFKDAIEQADAKAYRPPGAARRLYRYRCDVIQCGIERTYRNKFAVYGTCHVCGVGAMRLVEDAGSAGGGA